MKKSKVPTLKELENNFKEWKSDPERETVVKARNAKLKDAKDGKINMRVASEDLNALIKIADGKGLGYQTLLGSLIHQYVKGDLVDATEIRKVMPVPVKKRA
jgi:predicted DNA binding CopG/RHH family protein